jgi:hypothetical protein
MQFFKQFDSLYQYRDWLNSQPIPAKRKYTPSTESGNKAWYGTDSYDEADELFSGGDMDSFKKLIGGKVDYGGTGTDARRKMFSDVVGFAPNIGAVFAGDPRNMFNIRKSPVVSPVIDVVYCIGSSCGYSADEQSEVNNMMLNALQRIEDAGTRINLYIFRGAHINSDYTAFTIKVKDATENLSVYKLAYPLVNPSFQRRHGFRYIEVTDTQVIFNNWYTVEGDMARGILSQKSNIKADAVIDFYDIRRCNIQGVIDKIFESVK